MEIFSINLKQLAFPMTPHSGIIFSVTVKQIKIAGSPSVLDARMERLFKGCNLIVISI